MELVVDQRGLLSRHPRGVELAEVDRGGDDDRAAGDCPASMPSPPPPRFPKDLPSCTAPQTTRNPPRNVTQPVTRAMIFASMLMPPLRLWRRGGRGALRCVIRLCCGARERSFASRRRQPRRGWKLGPALLPEALPLPFPFALESPPRPFRVRSEVEGRAVFCPLVPRLDLVPPGMLRRVVLVVLERVGACYEE